MRSGSRSLFAVLGLATIILVVLAGCGDLVPSLRKPEGPANVTKVDERGYTDVDLDALNSALDDLALGGLSEPEMEAILYMREAEKLARDVLAVFYQQWNAEVFQRAAESEETHAEALKTLIDRYHLWDPSSVTWEGYFVNEELLALYRELVRQGERSQLEALRVGVRIEEISILDLREYRYETDDEDVQLVYENLLRASRNHLRVFAALLQEQGEAVENQYLGQTLFDEIVSTPPEPGMEADESADSSAE